jgi:hypothetical protein
VQGEIEWLSAEQMRVRLFGSVAILTGVQESRTSPGDSDAVAKPGDAPPPTVRSAFADVFRRRGSGWELAMVYAGELATQAPPSAQAQPAPRPGATPEKPEKPEKPPRGEDAPPVLRKPPGAF